MTTADIQQRESWHLNKGVPISLILAIVVQTAGAVWFAASMNAGIERNTEAIARNVASVNGNSARIDTLRTEGARLAVGMGRIEQSLISIERSLSRIDTKLEGQSK